MTAGLSSTDRGGLDAPHVAVLTALAHGDWMGRTAIRLALPRELAVPDETLTRVLRAAERAGELDARLLVRPNIWQWRRRLRPSEHG
jgi:hypothetical protein